MCALRFKLFDSISMMWNVWISICMMWDGSMWDVSCLMLMYRAGFFFICGILKVLVPRPAPNRHLFRLHIIAVHWVPVGKSGT
jgi:hypothetical protein